VAETDTVAGALELFRHPEQPDLIFSDIELLDGNVFEAFHEHPPRCPVIFTTAYNQFWMDAFRNNGIEYLLKPFTYERFEQAMHKYEALKNSFQAGQAALVQQLAGVLRDLPGRTDDYKKRFAVRVKDGIYLLETADIAYIQADGGVIKAFNAAGKMFLLQEQSLLELENKLDSQQFFRINRSELLNVTFIQKCAYYTKDRLSVHVHLPKPVVLYTSQSRTAEFRKWMEG
jgi:DNA-binding LytR/AlgR family response regulator